MSTIENANLYAHFSRRFERLADKVVLRDEKKSWRYRDLEALSARMAKCLLSCGLSAGDRVSVQVEKSAEAVCLYLACLRAGLVFHPLNTGYQPDELAYFISNAEPGMIVCDPRSKSTFETLQSSDSPCPVFALDADGSGSFMDQLPSQVEGFGVVHREDSDLAALLYSSGTTGRPKGIMLTHANLLTNAQALVEAWEFAEQDVLLHALPIFHVHGLFVALGCVFLSGASMQWLPAFDAPSVVERLPRCTVMMGVPTYYTRLLADEEFNRACVAGMRLFVSGSAPLLEETFVRFRERTGHEILERYGMTETNMNTSNPVDGERRPGTVGFPLPGVEVRIVADNGTVVPSGEVGAIQVRGPNVFSGYWRLPEKTAEDFTDDGFFNTGDQGRIDVDGYVSIVGRSKDLVITGGLNVYPKEIEQVIDKLPGILESAVIGVPHADFGEAVVAIAVPDGKDQPQEDPLRTELKQRLAGFKVPKRIVFVDALPRNTMGKVQKNLLRETYKNLF